MSENVAINQTADLQAIGSQNSRLLVRIFRLPNADENLSLPKAGDAGFDLRTPRSFKITTGQQILIETGLVFQIPEGWVGIIKDRSSCASKRLYTHGGVIDSSYRGEVKILLSYHGEGELTLEKGEKVAQLLVVPCLTSFCEVDSIQKLGETERGDGGFGSTGRF
jgi:dUTP pyrophosphatase